LRCFQRGSSMLPLRVRWLTAVLVLLPGVAAADEVRQFTHTSTVRGVSFSHDGKTLATGGYDSTLRLWNVEDGKALRTIYPSYSVYAVAFSPDSKLLAVGTSGGRYLPVFNAETGVSLRTFSNHPNYVHHVAFAPGGKLVASVGYERYV